MSKKEKKYDLKNPQDVAKYLYDKGFKNAQRDLNLYVKFLEQINDIEGYQALSKIISSENKEQIFDEFFNAQKNLNEKFKTLLDEQKKTISRLLKKDSSWIKKKEIALLEKENKEDVEQTFEYFVIIQKCKNEELAPYTEEKVGYFYFNGKEKDVEEKLDKTGVLHVERHNWFNERGCFLGDPTCSYADRVGIKTDDIRNGYKHVIADSQVYAFNIEPFDSYKHYSQENKRKQKRNDLAPLSFLLPYESRFVPLDEAFEYDSKDKAEFIEKEEENNESYKNYLTKTLHKNEKYIKDKVKLQELKAYIENKVNKQEQKIENQIQNYKQLKKHIASFDKHGLYDFLKAIHQTIGNVRQEYGKKYGQVIGQLDLEPYLRKVIFYQDLWTHTLTCLKKAQKQSEQASQKEAEEKKKENNKKNNERELPKVEMKKTNNTNKKSIEKTQKHQEIKLPLINRKLPIKQDIVKNFLSKERKRVNQIDKRLAELPKHYNANWRMIGNGKKHFREIYLQGLQIHQDHIFKQ